MLTSARRDVVRVIPCEARRLMGDALFLDIRNPQAWASSNEKIPGSIRIPPEEIERRIQDIPPGRTVVAY